MENMNVVFRQFGRIELLLKFNRFPAFVSSWSISLLLLFFFFFFKIWVFFFFLFLFFFLIVFFMVDGILKWEWNHRFSGEWISFKGMNDYSVEVFYFTFYWHSHPLIVLIQEDEKWAKITMAMDGVWSSLLSRLNMMGDGRTWAYWILAPNKCQSLCL